MLGVLDAGLSAPDDVEFTTVCPDSSELAVDCAAAALAAATDDSTGASSSDEGDAAAANVRSGVGAGAWKRSDSVPTFGRYGMVTVVRR